MGFGCSIVRRWIGLFLRLFLGFLFLAAGSGAFALSIREAFLKGPYLQAPGEQTMTIMWESATNIPGTLHYAQSGKPAQEVRLTSPLKVAGLSKYSVTNIDAEGKKHVRSISTTNIVYLYEATLTNLKPGSVYTYSVTMAGWQTLPKKFRTFAEHPAKVTFIAYGDTRSFPKMHTAIAQNFKRFSPDFILHTGDLVDGGKRYDVWGKDFFGPLARVIDEVPIFTVIGNHEDDGSNYLRYLHLPGKELWYSFDTGPLHVLCLDYRFVKDSPTNQQLRFAREDLAKSRAPWKIVMVHYPIYNVGGHDTSWGHKSYLPVFHETKVDLVLAGHSHLYERFRPLGPKNGTYTWPITHITTGGGGAELAPSHPHPGLAARASTNHFMVFEATRDTLRGHAFTALGQVIDSFELKKDNSGWPDDTVAKVYPEELLDLSFEAATNLVGKFAEVPGSNAPAPVMFTINPLPAAPNVSDMLISLTPASSAYYQLLDDPLHVTIPRNEQTREVVWARVVSTGRKKISGKMGEELSPSLIFQAEVRSSLGTTLAHGQKCKVSRTASELAKKMAAAQ